MDNKSYFAFVCKQNDDSVVVELGYDSAWSDLCDSFVGYLQACGFIVDGEVVADYFQGMYIDQMEAEKDA